MDEFLRLGESPRPSTSPELQNRIRDKILEQLNADPDAEVRGAERLRVQARLDGASIVALTVDASGIASDAVPEAAAPEEAIGQETALVTHREAAILREGSFVAAPLLYEGVPIDVEVRAVDVPFEWLTLTDGYIALGARPTAPHGKRRSTRLRLRIGINSDDILGAITRVVRTDLAGTDGILLDREELTLRQLGPRHIRISMSARLHWKFLRPTFRGRTDLHIDNHFIARLRRTRVTSSNVLLAVVLRILRGRIARSLNETVNLNDSVSPLALKTLRIHASGSQLRVDAEAGFA